MKRCTMIGGMMVMGLWSALAIAQSTLGELLDAGGKKLSKEQVRTALIGAHVTGKTFAGSTVETDYKADGTYSGFSTLAQGGSMGIDGTWKVDDGGKLCVEFRVPSGRINSSCAFYYTLSDQYYVSESDSERNSPVVKRALKK